MCISLRFGGFLVFAAVIAGTLVLTTMPALGHCDTEDGPVVRDARAALASGDVTPALKWIGPDDEPEIRSAFAKALAVRRAGGQARELAETWFFETLVRVHRAGEGAAYSGLKPAGTPLDPAVRLSDEALDTGNAEALVAALTAHLSDGVLERFREAFVLRAHAADNVEAGRAYVAAYVEFMHYSERLHRAIVSEVHAHEEGPDAGKDKTGGSR